MFVCVCVWGGLHFCGGVRVYFCGACVCVCLFIYVGCVCVSVVCVCMFL